MRRFVIPLALALGLAISPTIFAQNEQPAADEGPACCCPSIACDLFAGLRNLLLCPACPPVACPPQQCEPVVCAAPEPVCCAPLFPLLRARLECVREQVRAAVCCPPACPPPAVVEVKPVQCPPVPCPPVCRPGLIDMLRARMCCPAPRCQCGGLLGAVMQLIGCGPAPICCQGQVEQPTPAAAPSEAPSQLRPLQKAPSPDDISA